MGCAERPVVATVNTLCESTTRYHATEAQRAAFVANEPLWSSLVDWLASFNRVRDATCLKPAAG